MTRVAGTITVPLEEAYPSLPYDPLTDFVYAGYIGASPYVLAVNPTVHGTDVKGLIATLKQNPQNYSFASVGPGTVSHLLGEQFKAFTGWNATGM